MTERRCACGCGRSLDGMRSKARYASAACRTRDWKRRKGITGIRYTKASQNGKSRSGKQVTRGKAIDAAIRTALRFAENPDPQEVFETARQEVDRALPARQRLEQKEAA